MPRRNHKCAGQGREKVRGGARTHYRRIMRSLRAAGQTPPPICSDGPCPLPSVGVVTGPRADFLRSKQRSIKRTTGRSVVRGQQRSGCGDGAGSDTPGRRGGGQPQLDQHGEQPGRRQRPADRRLSWGISGTSVLAGAVPGHLRTAGSASRERRDRARVSGWAAERSACRRRVARTFA
jgi:hypothetical protein